MTELSKIKPWLESFPGWQQFGAMGVDCLPPQPGTALFPRGYDRVVEKRDILGGTRTKIRCVFLVQVLLPLRQADTGAQMLLQFARWVQQQGALGLAPALGDEPGQERIWAWDGRRKDTRKDGCAVYDIKLSTEFIILEKGE